MCVVINWFEERPRKKTSERKYFFLSSTSRIRLCVSKTALPRLAACVYGMNPTVLNQQGNNYSHHCKNKNTTCSKSCRGETVLTRGGETPKKNGKTHFFAS